MTWVHINQHWLDHKASVKCISLIKKNILNPFLPVLSSSLHLFRMYDSLRKLSQRTNIPHPPYDEMKEAGGWRTTKRIQRSLLSFCFSFFVSIPLCHLFFFPSLPPFSVPVSPSHGTLPAHPITSHSLFRAARHTAVLYFFAHFSRRLVPSHADPYHAPVQRGRRWRKRVIFSPWVRTPHDKW